MIRLQIKLVVCRRIILEGLRRAVLDSLGTAKLAIARVIRGCTAVSNRWLASELALGHVNAVSRCLHSNETTESLEQDLRRKVKPVSEQVSGAKFTD